jgi:hypothetical protein
MIMELSIPVLGSGVLPDDLWPSSGSDPIAIALTCGPVETDGLRIEFIDAV